MVPVPSDTISLLIKALRSHHITSLQPVNKAAASETRPSKIKIQLNYPAILLAPFAAFEKANNGLFLNHGRQTLFPIDQFDSSDLNVAKDKCPDSKRQ